MESLIESLLVWYQSKTTWELSWLGVGFFGQILFGCRFLVQWVVSEYEGRSVIPLEFWYLSISGSLILFVYATYQTDPVFMLGQSTGCFIYVRNLILLEDSTSLLTYKTSGSG
ncbi:MAG: lipid-A-disaccharide synthase N-terminal domain-containing protein [bacterium]